MKRNHANQKNTEKMIKLIRKIALHVALLCFVIMIETVVILKMGIIPETIQKISLLLFFIAAVIPAGALTGKGDFYDTIAYYFGILLIWTTIGVGFFDCEIVNLKQLGVCVLGAIAIHFVVQIFLNKKSSPKFRHR